MGGDENRSARNLLLLCLKHADEVDKPSREADYPPEDLGGWKAQQVASYDEAVGGWQLSDEEAAEVVDASFDSTIVIQATNLSVGGTGGSALGAAGGGGGAIGPGAVGGPGGAVGHVQLDGESGSAPGAGGGGGIIMPGAILPDPDRGMEGTEGRGFSVGTDGQAGTASSFGDLLTAEAGVAGLAGTGVRISSEHIRASVLMLVNYVESRDLAAIVGGGWQSCSVLNTPTEMTLPIFVVFEAGGVPCGEFSIGVEARGPDGAPRAKLQFPITVEKAGDVLRIPRACNLVTTIDSLGLWTVAVTTESGELGHIDLVIKRVGDA